MASCIGDADCGRGEGEDAHGEMSEMSEMSAADCGRVRGFCADFCADVGRGCGGLKLLSNTCVGMLRSTGDGIIGGDVTSGLPASTFPNTFAPPLSSSVCINAR